MLQGDSTQSRAGRAGKETALLACLLEPQAQIRRPAAGDVSHVCYLGQPAIERALLNSLSTETDNPRLHSTPSREFASRQVASPIQYVVASAETDKASFHIIFSFPPFFRILSFLRPPERNHTLSTAVRRSWTGMVDEEPEEGPRPALQVIVLVSAVRSSCFPMFHSPVAVASFDTVATRLSPKIPIEKRTCCGLFVSPGVLVDGRSLRIPTF